MKWIRSFEAKKADKKSNIVLKERGALLALDDINNIGPLNKIYKGETIFYKLIKKEKEKEDEIYDIMNPLSKDSGDIFGSELIKILYKFKEVDTSKSFKVEFKEKCQYYNTDFKLHREDGPAFILKNEDGSPSLTVWCKNGKRHREDGPAEIINNGEYDIEEYYHLNGRQLNKADYYIFIKSKKGEREDISKEELESMIVDLIDEYDTYQAKYSKHGMKWTVGLQGITTAKTYEHLASLELRLEDKGQSIVSITKNSTSLILSIQ